MLFRSDWAELQSCIVRSPGHCMVMGTASTMAAIGEALGMALPGNAAIPAVDSRRQQLAEASGRQIVQLVEQGLRPSTILTMDAFENAIRTLHAIGGSTNAIVHLIAIAGRVGLELPLGLFDALSRTTPFILNRHYRKYGFRAFHSQTRAEQRCRLGLVSFPHQRESRSVPQSGYPSSRA